MGFRRNAKAAQAQETKKSTADGKTTQQSKGSSGGKNYHNDIFQINESQEGTLYLKLNERKAEGLEITINGKKVTGFFSKDPLVQLEESVEAGRLSEEAAQKIADKIPEFVKSNVTVVTE